MKLASGPTRKATAPATSSGVPNLFSGVRSRIVALVSSGRPAVMRVPMNPGAMALTVMPREPTSFASDLVNPISPAFAAA